MNGNIKISIITINYNNRRGLLSTIHSVVEQMCKDFEYIVIDGGSTDGSVEVIMEYADKIDYWISERDRGIYHAMNKGIDQAHGEYCLFLNSGDTLYDSGVIHSVLPLLTSDIVIGAIKKNASGYVKKVKVTEPLCLLDFWFENPIPHQSTFIKRKICEKLHYDESLKIVGDLKFFLQAIVSLKCKCQSIDCIVANFDENGISTQVNSDDEWKRVFTEILPSSLFVDCEKMLQRDYEQFYALLKLRKYYKMIYMISVLIVRLIAWVHPTARFARKFPLILK